METTSSKSYHMCVRYSYVAQPFRTTTSYDIYVYYYGILVLPIYFLHCELYKMRLLDLSE